MSRRFIWPSTTWWVLLLVLLAVSTFLTNFSTTQWGPPQWHVLTGVTRETLIFPAIILSAFAAQLGKVFSANSVVVGRNAPRARSVVAAHSLLLTSTSIVGYSIGIAPTFWLTLRGADAGSPDLLALASIYVSLTATGFLAYALATWIRTRWASIVAPLVCVLLLVLPAVVNPALGSSGRSTLQSAFIWLNNFPTIGWQVTPQTSAFRIALFALVIVASISSIIYVVTKSGVGALLQMLTLWVAAGIMTLTSVALSPHLVRQLPEDAVCETTDQATMTCLHPSYQSLAPKVSKTVEEITAIFGTLSPVEVVQQIGTAPVNDSREPVWFNMDRLQSENDLQRAVATPILYQTTGGPACEERAAEYPPGVDIPSDVLDAHLIHLAIVDTVLQRLGLEQDVRMEADEATGEATEFHAFTVFRDMDDESLKTWLATHTHEIQTCTVRNADLS